MKVWRLPGNSGWTVWDGRTGRNSFSLPCRDRAQAEELCRRINEHDHDGEIWT
ncbi:MAG TPA: hypothetical protein VF771_05000 [Longimicrobiaceae bacterium]